TGLELAAPLKFTHSGNLPFSNRGTGISFTPASSFDRSTNEPIVPLGTGITLDRPLSDAHGINDVVRVDGVTMAGYQGGPAPQQWFGGPSLSPAAGTMFLHDADGRTVDSLNYGLIVQPEMAEGYHAVSGTGEAGCRAPAAGGLGGRGATLSTNSSGGRFPDGHDTDSNCNDFLAQAATVLPAGAMVGSVVVHVQTVKNFAAGQSITIGTGSGAEVATIASVGTPGAMKTSVAVAAGETLIPIGSPNAGFGFQHGFIAGQAVTVGEGATQQKTTVLAVQGGRNGLRMMIADPLRTAQPEGVLVAGTGLTLSRPLTKAHGEKSEVSTDQPTPGQPNRYSQAAQ
ncbi:MAG: hypothetical protein ABIP44_09655, partial [Pseudoxanthomonas sp.]